jgi:hypothetical protein
MAGIRILARGIMMKNFTKTVDKQLLKNIPEESLVPLNRTQVRTLQQAR